MNKLRLIKIYEIRGKVHPIEQKVIDILFNLEKEYNSVIGGLQYTKDNLLYFDYSPETGNLWIYYFLVIFDKVFKCNKVDSCEILKYLIGKHLKININEAF